MNKKFIPIFLIIIAVLVAYAVAPDVKESLKPVNRIINQATDQGAAIVIQVVSSEQEASTAQQVFKAFRASPNGNVVTGVVMADESRAFIRKHGIFVPGYIIMDSHANPVGTTPGIISESDLRQAAASLHAH